MPFFHPLESPLTCHSLSRYQSTHVLACFTAQRSLVKLAANCIKPPGGFASSESASLLKPLQEALTQVTSIREKNRSERVLFNHLSAVSEGIPAVGWLTVEPKPGPFVSEMKDSSQFYTNRVIKELKDTDKTHVEWCRAFVKILDVLKEYIMKHHTTGLTWNPKVSRRSATSRDSVLVLICLSLTTQGGDVASYSDNSSAVPAAPAPPPPPSALAADGDALPPQPPPPKADLPSSSAGGGGMGAVFQSLNQGEGITSSLKKVDPSQMTHKNPALREAAISPSVASITKPTPPKPASKPMAMRPKKPARTVLEGNKWNLENHEDNKMIVIDATELNHSVNIFSCKNCVIQVKGKINAVAMGEFRVRLRRIIDDK